MRASRGSALGRVVAAAAVILALVGGAVVGPPPAVADAAGSTSGALTTGASVKAANLADFRAGNIISDATFFNAGTMSASQIQAFLEARVPSCQAGYTCLKDWYDTSRSTTADAMCGAYSGGYRERASDIIYKVAQACGINPQVLLVTLQKEQGLVTHTWPSEWRYTVAMGQGCPDTAACDTRYYGFFNQVYGAAWQFKRYANPPGTSQYFTWYAPGRTWNILYHPNRDCGSSPVYVENQATANLYYYTPYQPNAAALRAGYGVGDGCSSYGNRNFYNYFTDWFGSTQQSAPPPPPPAYGTSPLVMALDAAGTLWAYPFGARQWGQRVQVLAGIQDAASLLTVGDMDGDGRRDVLVVDSQGVVRLYPQEGGSSDLSRTVPVDWSGTVERSAAGDFTGDGVPDAFTTDATGTLSVWSGSGYGGFAAPRAVGSGWVGFDILAGGVDLDGDRIGDLLARGPDGVLRIYRANGAGGWRGSVVIGDGWTGFASVTPADFTGDSLTDLLAVDSAGVMWVYRGNGAAGYIREGAVGSAWQYMQAVTGEGSAPTGVRVFPGGAGDFDGDSDADVTAVTQDGQLLIYPGNGTGGWKQPVPLGAVSVGTRVVPLGDFTGDASPDLGIIAADGTFGLRSGGAANSTDIGQGWGGLSLVAGGLDFDGDRRTDVVARDGDGSLWLYRGDGAGGWRTGNAELIGTGWQVFDTLSYAGDFDGDRRPDLIARKSDGTLWLYPTDGAGSWRTPAAIGTGWTIMTAVTTPGDFDGGGTDVMGRLPNGDLVVYRGDGRGGWSGSYVAGTGWNIMAQIN